MNSEKINEKGSIYPSECTTVIVGNKMTDDGSMIVARSEDWNTMFAKNLEIYEDTAEGPETFVARDGLQHGGRRYECH